jgi:opacity protein-like surface antigen
MFKVHWSLVIACVCVQSVFGQSSYAPENKDWEFSGFAGGSFLGKFQFPTTISGGGQQGSQNVGMHYGSGYELGLRLSENLGNSWGSDLEYSFATQPLTFTNLSPTIPSLALSHTVNHFTYSVAYIPLSRFSRFRPYAKVGSGASLFYISKTSKQEALEQGLELRDSWKFLVNWGGGFTYLIHPPVAIRFDVKDYISGVPSYGLPPTARVVNGRFQPGLARNGLMNNWQMNFGVIYQWDD